MNAVNVGLKACPGVQADGRLQIQQEGLAAADMLSLLPQVQQHLNYWLRNNGKRLVIEKLDLSRRIENSIREQDVREFHAMINAVAAEHLGAIQVLGYVLGFVIGLFQVVAGFR